jgi:hypothetical protein
MAIAFCHGRFSVDPNATGCASGPARCMPWLQGAAGSNPAAPTNLINKLSKTRTRSWAETWADWIVCECGLRSLRIGVGLLTALETTIEQPR